jgi:hypothetical protein
MPIAQASASVRSLAAPALAWPESVLYVSEKYRLVYCPIQKVACSSIKLWWAGLHNRAPDDFLVADSRGQIIIDHRKLNELFRLQYFPHLGQEPVTDDAWFRVVFVRNPWARLVSAFLNKFIERQPLARPVYRVVHRRWRSRTALRLRDAVLSPLRNMRGEATEQLRDTLWPALLGRTAWEEELTFRHFVEYLSGCDLDGGDVDLHWRPQYRFLGDLQFQYVGRFERLADDIRTVASLLGVPANLPSVNRTKYVASHDASTCVTDYSLRELRQLPSMPSYRQFYTRQLADQVAGLYRRDVEQFEYAFGE